MARRGEAKSGLQNRGQQAAIALAPVFSKAD